jgi:amino acid permease
MARDIGSAAWLLVIWVVTGLITVAAALSYGELAGMMPNAGGCLHSARLRQISFILIAGPFYGNSNGLLLQLQLLLQIMPPSSFLF